MQFSLQDVTFAQWRELVPHRFQVRNGSETVELELAEAVLSHADSPAFATTGWESFSLFFLGPAQPSLPQGLYPMKSDRTGDFDLFIVPLGPAAGAMRYQAVFNRLVQPR